MTATVSPFLSVVESGIAKLSERKQPLHLAADVDIEVLGGARDDGALGGLASSEVGVLLFELGEDIAEGELFRRWGIFNGGVVVLRRAGGLLGHGVFLRRWNWGVRISHGRRKYGSILSQTRAAILDGLRKVRCGGWHGWMRRCGERPSQGARWPGC